MVGYTRRRPGDSRFKNAAWLLGITLGTTAISLVVAASVVFAVYGFVEPASIVTAVILPIALTPPIAIIINLRHKQLKHANAELHKLAYQDSLLDCMNRRGFTSALGTELQYASPHNPCALLIIDADNFKRVNDQFGHDQGDAALKIILGAIKVTIRSSDILARIGGEEFGLFLPDTDEEQARIIAKRICARVASEMFAPTGRNHRLSVSIGGAIADRPTSFEKIFKIADQRLYVAKNSGRNRADFSRPILREQQLVG